MFCRSRLKFLWNSKSTLKKLPNTFKFLPKCQSGHTVCEISSHTSSCAGSILWSRPIYIKNNCFPLTVEKKKFNTRWLEMAHQKSILWQAWSLCDPMIYYIISAQRSTSNLFDQSGRQLLHLERGREPRQRHHVRRTHRKWRHRIVRIWGIISVWQLVTWLVTFNFNRLLIFLKNGPFFILIIFNTVHSMETSKMTWFEPRISSLGGDGSTNWATTTADVKLIL